MLINQSFEIDLISKELQNLNTASVMMMKKK